MSMAPQFEVNAHCLWCDGKPPETDNPPEGPWVWLEKWMAIHEVACVEPRSDSQ